MMKILLCLIVVFANGIVFAQNPDNNFVYPKNDSINGRTTVKNSSDDYITSKRGSLNKNETQNKHRNLWIGLNVEPQFQNVFKSPKQFQDFASQNPGSYLKLSPGGGAQAGIKLYYLPTGAAGFETGLQYHFYESGQLEFYPLGGTTAVYSVLNKFHNLEVPLLVDIHSHGRKVRFYSSDGITAGITLGAAHFLSASAPGYTSFDSSFRTHADSSTSFYCTILTSAGMQVSITPDILFNLTLAFRISSSGVLGAVNPFYSPGQYAFVPYSLGLNAEVLLQTGGRNKNRNGSFTIASGDNDQKMQDRLRKKHQSWYSCFVVMLTGDTIRGKVKQSADFPVTGYLFGAGRFLFAHSDESEERIGAAQFKELYVADEGREYRKYITLDSRAETDNREIFRVVEDGKCRLLSDEINGPGVGALSDKAYIYYKSKLTKVNLNAAIDKTPEFKNQCAVIFSDCPALVQQIANNGKGLSGWGGVVLAFNECIKTN